MRFADWQDRGKNESNDRRVWGNRNLCDCRNDDSGGILAAASKNKRKLSREEMMRILWNEYGALILGAVGAAAIMGMVANILMPEGGVYELLLTFSRNIC